MKPRIDPTDRSMLRDTMISTMPVAMIATAAVWTDRFHRLRGDRNRPPEQMWKHDPDDDEGCDHAEQARVDLRSRDQRRKRAAMFLVRPALPDGAGSAGRGLAIEVLLPEMRSAPAPGAGPSAGRCCHNRLTTIGYGQAATSPRSHLADLLVNPAGVDHQVEVALRDRHRVQDDRLDLDATRGRELGRSRAGRRDGVCRQAVRRRHGV